MTDPENTCPKRIKRAVPLFFNPPETELDRHLIGKDIDNGKYYSLQKARIKKKQMPEDSGFILFKDNEVFFCNSGGVIVACDGGLMGVVSMMSNHRNAALKQGIGINARTLLEHARRLGLI